MAFTDWNGDGKNDIVDDSIEYNLVQNSINNSGTGGGGNRPSGGGSTSSAVLCAIAGLVEDALFFALLGIDADDIPIVVLVIMWAVFALITSAVTDAWGKR